MCMTESSRKAVEYGTSVEEATFGEGSLQSRAQPGGAQGEGRL